MKIVIDGRMIDWTGIGRYTRRLIDSLQDLDHDNQYTVLLLQSDFESWQPTNPNFSKLVADIPGYSLDEQVQLALLLYRLKPDLVHFIAPNHPILYWGRHVTTIHDLTLIDFTWSPLVKRLAFRLAVWAAMHGSKRVIAQTEFGKRQLSQRYRVPERRIAMTSTGFEPPSASTAPASLSRFGIDRPFLLYVGNFYPHKNLGGLVSAQKQLRDSCGKDYQLVLVGTANSFQEELRAQVKQLGLEDVVRFTGWVDDAELAGLYREAKLFVFPSLSEGFGLPPLEAMAYDLPVISSDATCIPEVLGNAADYFDPTSPSDMAEKINRLLEDPAEQKRLRQAGRERIRQFPWKQAATKTLAVYQQALAN